MQSALNDDDLLQVDHLLLDVDNEVEIYEMIYHKCLSSRCRMLYAIMTYLTLTTYCWMLCEGIHIFICLEHPLQVAQNAKRLFWVFKFSWRLQDCLFRERHSLHDFDLVRNCALIFLPPQIVLLSSRFLYLRQIQSLQFSASWTKCFFSAKFPCVFLILNKLLLSVKKTARDRGNDSTIKTQTL